MLSFVIPAYNEEKLIRRCILSIKREMSESFQAVPYEIIVVDNNSTDDTCHIVQETGVDVLLLEERKGVVYARNTGAQRAKYPWIAFIDADNEVSYRWFNNVSRIIDRATYIDRSIVAFSGPFVYTDYGKGFLKLSKSFYKIGEICHKHFGPMLQGGNFILKREALEKIGWFDTTIEFYGEDTLTAKRISKIGKILFVPDMFVYASGRRLSEEGIILTTARYILNYAWVTLFHKPFTKKYQDIRP